MVIFHSYVSLPEGNQQVSTAATAWAFWCPTSKKSPSRGGSFRLGLSREPCFLSWKVPVKYRKLYWTSNPELGEESNYGIQPYSKVKAYGFSVKLFLQIGPLIQTKWGVGWFSHGPPNFDGWHWFFHIFWISISILLVKFPNVERHPLIILLMTWWNR